MRDHISPHKKGYNTSTDKRRSKNNLIPSSHLTSLLEKQDHKQTKHKENQQQVPHRNYSSLYKYRPSVALSFSYTSSESSSRQSQDES
jgi:hypothetical protein